MQTTHHAGKIAAIQQSFVSRMVASHLLLSRKQVSPSFTSQHILWSGRRRANCYWTHCMHGGEKCHAIQKSRLGEWFSCVLNQWGALCYYSVDGQAEADIMPRKKPFVPSVSEIKTLCSSTASAVHCCMGLSALAFWTTLIRKSICAISWAYCRNNLPTVLMNSCHGT